MASESRAGSDNVPPMKLRGYVVVGAIGGSIGYLLLEETLALIFGPQTGSQRFFPTFAVGWVVGGAIGGGVQLWRQHRSAEIGKFLGQQVVGLLIVLAVWLAVWLGQRLYGDIGWWGGLIGSAGLIVLASWLWRQFSSSRRQEPPPG